MEDRKISALLHENETYIRKRCENCDDILIRPMVLGEGHKVNCLMVYIEVTVSNMMLDDSAIGKMVNHFWEIPAERSGNLSGKTVLESLMQKNYLPWRKCFLQCLREMLFSLWMAMTKP